MKRVVWYAMVLITLMTLILGFETVGAYEIPLRVVVNNQQVSFPDEQPFIDGSGRTQVPVRFVSQALGARVEWDGGSRTVALSLGEKKAAFVIGNREYTVDGQRQQMDTAALLKGDRTFVPARFVSEALGATVRWDSAVRTVYIDMKKAADTGETRNVSGFIVPKDIQLAVSSPRDDINYETTLTIDFLKRDVEKQKDDMEQILLQRLGSDSVKQIMDHIRPKMQATDVIEKKIVYDSKTAQYIGVTKSVSETITVWIYKKGVRPYGY